MKKLTIFYDPACGVCTGFRRWMLGQEARVRLEFVPYQSCRAKELCPDLLQRGADREIVVLADDGRLWQGAGAWVTCLWTLRRWRAWSKRLASPALLPLAAKLCKLISSNRMTISRLLRLRNDHEIADAVETMWQTRPGERKALRRAHHETGREAK